MEREERKQIRSFAIALAVVLAAIGSIPLTREKDPVLWCYLAAAASLVLGLACPAAMKPIFRGWMALARAIGTANAYILLTLLFVFVFVPAGILLRLIGKDFLDRRIEPHRSSYWQPCEEPESVEDYFRQF